MPAPAAPTSVAIARRGTHIVTNSATLSQYLYAAFDFEWAIVSGIRYRVQWDQGNQNGELLGVGVGVKRFTSLTISPNYPASVNGLQVRAENDDGVSAWTPVPALYYIAPSAGSGTADVPGAVTAGSVKPRSFAFAWTSPNTNVSYFECRIVGITTTQNFTLRFPSVDRAAVITGLLPAQTYQVELRAVVGLGTSSGLTGITPTAWSTAISVSTLADAIQITAPASGTVITAWRTITYNTGAPAFSVLTSSNATVRSASGLPGTLAIVGTVPVATFTIEGNVTAAIVGTYAATINVTDAAANSDALAVNVLVRDPAIAIAPAPQNGIVGTAFTFTVPWTKLGPVGDPATWALRFAPAFLSINASGVIIGTPDAPGIYAFEVRGGNGTQSDTQPMTLTVTGLAITSVAEIGVYQNARVDHTLTANASNATFSALNLPAWLTLVGAKLTGTAAVEPADFFVQITATNATDTATQLLTVHVLSVLSTVTPWQMHLNRPAFQTIRWLGDGAVEAWYLTDGPGGLTIANDPGTGSIAGRASVSGAPTETGFFTVIVTARAVVAGETVLFEKAVECVVAGGLFLPWLHVDPFLFDLQVQIRGDAARRVVQSYYATAVLVHPERTVTSVEGGTTTEQTESAQSVGNSLVLKRGDTAKLAILLRDGRSIVTDGVTQVQLVLREPEADREDEYLLAVDGVLTAIDGRSYFAANCVVSSDIVDAIFDRDARPSIETIAELSWFSAGEPYSAMNFPAIILRDENRAVRDLLAPIGGGGGGSITLDSADITLDDTTITLDHS